jgi:hypothetical protein
VLRGILLLSCPFAGCGAGTSAPPAAPPAPVAAPVAPAPPPPVAPAAPAAWDGRRIVAVGDLHGDLNNAVATLAMMGVVDGSGRWAGGDTVLVQTGDTVDRGPDSRAVLAWLRQLQAEAPAAGGAVVALLGNHEVMNLRGDLRYVAPEDVAAYGGDEARRAAFSATGDDGRWLRTLPVSARLGDTVFVHGGILPELAAGGVDALNATAKAALDAPGKPAVLDESGPLWYRGYVNDPEPTACPTLADALRRLGARRMVVGHTTRRDGRVQARCDGALLVIDVGISDHYGAHLGAIELRGGVDAWAASGVMTDPPSIPVPQAVDLPDPRG